MKRKKIEAVLPKTETRELTFYDLDKMIAEGTVSSQHPIIQQLAAQRVKALSSQPQKGKSE